MAEDGQAAPQSTKKKPEGDLSEYNLDNYDEDEEQETGMSVGFLFNCSGVHNCAGPFSTIKGLTYYRDNNDDPYITLKEVRAFRDQYFILRYTYLRKGRRRRRARRTRSSTNRQPPRHRKNRRRSLPTRDLRL